MPSKLFQSALIGRAQPALPDKEDNNARHALLREHGMEMPVAMEG